VDLVFAVLLPSFFALLLFVPGHGRNFAGTVPHMLAVQSVVETLYFWRGRFAKCGRAAKTVLQSARKRGRLTRQWPGRSLNMKRRMSIIAGLAVATCCAVGEPAEQGSLPASAQISSTPFAAATTPAGKVQLANPFRKTRANAGERAPVDRYGNISSRPWAQAAGWRPEDPTSFMDLKNHDAEMPLLWVWIGPQ
jgi:hypothetical protein